MPDIKDCSIRTKRTPWNKGKLIGARPPLRPKHVWSIRTRLMLEGRGRDLALFNLAIDSGFAVAMSWPLRSRTLHQAAIQWIAQQCGRRRRGDQSSLS
jgi:hypothetical protein